MLSPCLGHASTSKQVFASLSKTDLWKSEFAEQLNEVFVLQNNPASYTIPVNSELPQESIKSDLLRKEKRRCYPTLPATQSSQGQDAYSHTPAPNPEGCGGWGGNWGSEHALPSVHGQAEGRAWPWGTTIPEMIEICPRAGQLHLRFWHSWGTQPPEDLPGQPTTPCL